MLSKVLQLGQKHVGDNTVAPRYVRVRIIFIEPLELVRRAGKSPAGELVHLRTWNFGRLATTEFEGCRTIRVSPDEYS
ncbi:hypothetical protein C0992_012001, partial [Termitomyces sp. T32_za158]